MSSDEEQRRAGPKPESPDDQDGEWPPIIGEVGDPMTEEEAETLDVAWWALHLPPATDEEVAEMERQAEIAEQSHLRIRQLIRRRRAYEAKHDQK